MIIQRDTDGGSVHEACLKVSIFAVSSGDASGAAMTHFSFHVLINKHFYFHSSNVPLSSNLHRSCCSFHALLTYRAVIHQPSEHEDMENDCTTYLNNIKDSVGYAVLQFT